MIEKLKKEENSGWIDENGTLWFTKKDYIFCHLFGFCNCGIPDKMFIFIRDNLQNLKDEKYGEYSNMAYMFFVYWAETKNITEHGSTIRCSWLTEFGEEVLKDMNWCIDNEIKDEKL